MAAGTRADCRSNRPAVRVGSYSFARHSSTVHARLTDHYGPDDNEEEEEEEEDDNDDGGGGGGDDAGADEEEEEEEEEEGDEDGEPGQQEGTIATRLRERGRRRRPRRRQPVPTPVITARKPPPRRPVRADYSAVEGALRNGKLRRGADGIKTEDGGDDDDDDGAGAAGERTGGTAETDEDDDGTGRYSLRQRKTVNYRVPEIYRDMGVRAPTPDAKYVPHASPQRMC
jgi:hypothetical protein